MFFLCFSVTEFSKKTGDYLSLSATDIKVLALTYQLELEHVGSQHLKKEPEVKVPERRHVFTVCLLRRRSFYWSSLNDDVVVSSSSSSSSMF